MLDSITKSNTEFSQSSLNQLQVRSLTDDEISGFGNILRQANEQTTTSKEFLKSLSSDELQLVKKANSLAANIDVDSLSQEGAQNLLSQPDGSDLVDLNNDGIVEIGIGKTIHFPPVNAPPHVKAAWEKATEGMDWGEQARMELTMFSMVYGFGINGVTADAALPPEQQWNTTNINAFYEYAQSNLEFRIGMEGWTDYNRQLDKVYDSFFSSIRQSSISTFQPQQNASAIKSSSLTDQTTTTPMSPSDRIKEVNQLVLDAKSESDLES
ncbi:hypothetical protein [Alteromonas stellipolaris]|uniref:hypothetical protein n=1 Tax=Alteromonas stellipolaris TaxID=233316 RepID=UPI001D1F55D3|nr:hypothetical protein [Alteromonas stellipolaris]MBZ2160550.1 hypothetical protein [Alteromonas stellipolaris]